MSDYLTSTPVVPQVDPWWVPAARAVVLATGAALLSSTILGVLLVMASFSILDVVAVPPLAGLLVGLPVFLGLAWVGFEDHKRGAVGSGGKAQPGRVVQPIIMRVPGSQSDQVDDDQGPGVVDGRAALYQFLRRAYLVGLARGSWVGEKVPAGVRVSRDQYDAFIVSLSRSGIAANDGRGYRLVVSIEQAMKAAGLLSLWSSDGRPGGMAGGSDTVGQSVPRLRVVGKGRAG